MIAQLDSRYLRTRPSKAYARLVSYLFFEGRPVTTRGQWINPIVLSLMAFEKRLPRIRKVTAPIFITGLGRSGTTVLGVVLSMHRDVGFLNEPKALWHSICPHEDVIGSYSRGIALYRLGKHDCKKEYVRNAHRLYGAYLAATMTKRVVDKYPELIFRIPFVRSIFPDARFIFLARNGWDACSSIDKWSIRLGKQRNGEIHDWWGVNRRKWKLLVGELIEPDPYFAGVKNLACNLTDHKNMAVIEWILTMREGLRRERENEDSMIMVRYEDLAQSPRSVLSELTSFAGLEDDETFFSHGVAVLRPASRHHEFEMHPKIRPLFDETMSALGYT